MVDNILADMARVIKLTTYLQRAFDMQLWLIYDTIGHTTCAIIPRSFKDISSVCIAFVRIIPSIRKISCSVKSSPQFLMSKSTTLILRSKRLFFLGLPKYHL